MKTKTYLMIATLICLIEGNTKAETSFESCNSALPYLQSYKEHNSKSSYQEDLKQYIRLHDYNESKNKFSVDATIPIGDALVPFNTDQQTYENVQHRLQQDTEHRISKQESDYLMQRWMPADALGAYQYCLSQVSDKALVCQFIPSGDPNDSSKAFFWVKNNLLSKMRVLSATLGSSQAIEFDAHPLTGGDLLKSDLFPKQLEITKTGMSFSIYRSDKAVHQTLTATIKVDYQADHNRPSESCRAVLPAIPAPPEIVECRGNDCAGQPKMPSLSKWYFIKSASKNLDLNVYGDQTAGIIRMPLCIAERNETQRWRFIKVGEDSYEIKAKLGGNIVGRSTRTNLIGDQIVQGAPGDLAQTWKLEPAGNGQFKIRASNSDVYLAVGIQGNSPGGLHYSLHQGPASEAETWILDMQGDIVQ